MDTEYYDNTEFEHTLKITGLYIRLNKKILQIDREHKHESNL